MRYVDVPIDMSAEAADVATEEELRNCTLLMQWYGRLAKFGKTIEVRSIFVHAARKWGEPREIKMMYMDVDAYDPDGNKLPGLTFLRGDSVDILPVLVCGGVHYVALVDQYRVAGGQDLVRSTPAGMIDPGEDFNEAALRELGEETKAQGIKWGNPIDLAGGLLGTARPLLGSPGGSDERVYFMASIAQVTQKQLDELNGSFGGHDADERTTVRIVPLDEAFAHLSPGGRYIDMKTVLSLLLFQDYLRFMEATKAACEA